MASLQQLLGRTVGRVLFKHVTISNVVDLTPHFRLFELYGDVGVPLAGDKIQVHLDAGMRTYTPFDFDAAKRTVRLLAYVHSAHAPAARWAREARRGDELAFFGPRSSLPLETIKGPVVFVGDETSFGAARALLDAGQANVRCVFEVNDASESAVALAALRIAEPTLVQRESSSAHLPSMLAAVEDSSEPETQLVLTGRAQTIQRLRAGLKAAGTTARQYTKAYWAEGKRGLD